MSVYYLLLQLGLKQITAATAAFLILFGKWTEKAQNVAIVLIDDFLDNAMLTQSRFILMEPMLLLFSVFGLYCFLKFIRLRDYPYCFTWFLWLAVGILSLTAAVW